jgi:hypothetical protein
LRALTVAVARAIETEEALIVDGICETNDGPASGRSLVAALVSRSPSQKVRSTRCVIGEPMHAPEMHRITDLRSTSCHGAILRSLRNGRLLSRRMSED